MDCSRLLVIACLVVMVTMVSAWSRPYYPVRRLPVRVTRYAPPPPPHRIPVPPPEMKWERPKRDHDHDHDIDHDHDRDTNGVTGPVHTFVKTDKNANYKWGVRHHVGNKFAS